MTWIGFTTVIQFYYTAAWHTCTDVLQEPGPVWEYGLPGSGIMDLVADTGILTFTLDNSSRNSASTAGYYSPGHASCASWFTDGLPIQVIITRTDVPTSVTKFVGIMTSARATSGAWREAVTEVEARDWMDYAASQKIGLLAIQSGAGLGVDDVLTAALVNMPVQPTSTHFDVGRESFPIIFNSDSAKDMSMMALFQKYARNECLGYIYLTGAGRLTFDNRHARPLTTADAFTLDATAGPPMTDLELSFDRDAVVNKIEVTLYPTLVDTGADTVLWQLEDPFPISPGQVVTMDLPFRDPDTGKFISGQNVVTPLVSGTHIKFGSLDDGTSNDLIASLTFPITIGGNSVHIVLTNSGSASGYVNMLKILGDGYYIYEPMILNTEDAASVAAKGPRPLSLDLEQITSPTTGKLAMDFLLGQLLTPAIKVERVRFLANYDTTLAAAAITVEPNTRFAMTEPQSGISGSWFACRLRFEQIGTQLWVEIVPSKAGAAQNYFIWNTADHGWDEGVWIF